MGDPVTLLVADPGARGGAAVLAVHIYSDRIEGEPMRRTAEAGGTGRAAPGNTPGGSRAAPGNTPCGARRVRLVRRVRWGKIFHRPAI
ncbi:hypothetical protein Ssi02_54930 [Sinosporangium siamense]|uniref:Uncharacterized protein n=1 Tax=Sinosporangium siamense TaxID=1367973 RepID=A0A919RL85_9ACTN|nr:hypothetical protein Ssi02_54930 [Sinosporangium siamense]